MMATIDSNGASIHYQLEGRPDGPWLVFSNSLGTNLSMWDAQAARFGRHFRILRYDSRGHGSSSVPEGPYTIEQLGHDALALLDALEIEQAHFCGLSMGGMVGMWLGVNAPGRLAKLALCNTAACMPQPDLWNERIETATGRGMSALCDGIVERWFTAGFRQQQPDAVERVRQMVLSTDGRGYAGCCAAIRDMDQRESIRGIAVPTLVIAGESDPATPPDKGEEIADAVSGAKLIVLPAAHLSNIEAEEQFTCALDDFWNM